MSLKTNTNVNSAGDVLNRLENVAEKPFRAVGAILGKSPRLVVEGAMIYGGYEAASSGWNHGKDLISGRVEFGPNAFADPVLHYGLAGAGIVGGGALMVAGTVSAINTGAKAIREEFAANQA